MNSKRTISYIGLWALIMPWLGFTWETKTVLFSLTGIILLIIGNRQYHNEKKKHLNKKDDQNIVNHPIPNLNNDFSDYRKNETIYSSPSVLNNNLVQTMDINPVIKNEPLPVVKPRIRKKIEMSPRPRKIAIKKDPVFINNDMNIDQNELSDFS